MKVPVTVNQKVNGYQYTGTIQIGERKYEWELHLGAHIDRILSQAEKPDSKEALRRLFNVTLKVGDKVVDITDELFGFLMRTVVILVLEFYQESQTRDFNEGPIAFFASQLGGVATCGMESAYDIPEDCLPKALVA